MKTLKKTFLSLALATLLLPTMLVAPAQAEGPFETYLTCASGCIDKYAPWTLRRSACAADCYLAIGGNAVKALVGLF